MQSRTVQLGPHSVTLRTPPSFALARVVSVALSQSPLLGLGAALGACWGGKPLKATLKAHQHDACAYGAAVVDELHALGIPEAEIWAAAGVAVELLTSSTPTEAGVAAAADFTAPPAAASTP
jgi:hypothetical protein